MENSLDIEVLKFKKWASNIPKESRFGEWECDYPHWSRLYKSLNDYLLSNSPENASQKDIENLIYVVARDNEMEDAVSKIAASPNWFRFLLPTVINCNEPDTKWQFAVELGNGVLEGIGAERALVHLFNDANEYVSRRALQSLGKIGSTQAEELCERAWLTNHEYQRIMVLWVLKDINSIHLLKFIELAIKDGRRYLVDNAKKIMKIA